MELNYVPDNTGFQTLTSGAALPLAFKGVFNVTFIDDIFTYTKDSNSLVPPFKPSVDLIINSVTDADEIIAEGVDDDGNTSESITLNPTGADSQIRFGRLHTRI
jgi:hypothetical protein